ncbi:DUF5344 family protein [Peribacillus frigoritolerans]|uniref:DUF5344 family protein n=1 Tax=Peribacillus frigoritolerans TaxID=450367 RepID=UPI00203C2570|nr:DUF5344 family protein [Peribacillus frigoritolerans]MCM3169368.1 YwqI/YxiC family protein [Peribacillus frigoritolerans]
MSEEMKVRYRDVDDAISKIESASEAFETSLMKEMASGNELDVVNKLNELNGMLEEIGTVYKNVLKENNQSVIKILQELKEADHNISSSIKVR